MPSTLKLCLYSFTSVDCFLLYLRGGSTGRMQGVRTPPPKKACGFLINTVQSASQLYKICFIIWYVFSAVHIMLLPSRKPSSSYSLLKFVYVTSQLRHSLVVHPLLRKILDPPLYLISICNFFNINHNFIVVHLYSVFHYSIYYCYFIFIYYLSLSTDLCVQIMHTSGKGHSMPFIGSAWLSPNDCIFFFFFRYTMIQSFLRFAIIVLISVVQHEEQSFLPIWGFKQAQYLCKVSRCIRKAWVVIIILWFFVVIPSLQKQNRG